MKVPAFVLLVFCFILNYYASEAQISSAYFERITNKDGLPHSAINDILQDRKGFMWFATYDGLIKYDGYSYKVYRNIVGDKNSLSDNGVSIIYEDSEGFIWVMVVFIADSFKSRS